MKNDKCKTKVWAFIKTKTFIYNLFAAILLVFILLLILSFSLKLYTRHSKSQAVPNYIGMLAEEAFQNIKENGFDYIVIDTVFDNSVSKGSIVEQNPKPGSLVKSGRKIYVKVNSKDDEMISMPQFIGMSVKMVNSMAETYGFVVGSLKYVPDIATNVVIRQLYKGKDIDPGVKIKKGAKIDLVLGLGLSDKTTSVPSLIGMTYREASNNLLDLYLNVGAVLYDNTVKNSQDSARAKIYRQSPRGSTINEVNLGYSVDIWLTRDENAISAVLDQEENEEEEINE